MRAVQLNWDDCVTGSSRLHRESFGSSNHTHFFPTETCIFDCHAKESVFVVLVAGSKSVGSGLLGIGFSVVVVIVAALNLVLDFDFIESGVSAGAPKYMEWYGAFGLIVTLVWLYLEILRLLAKLNSRR
jgi:hypothetical protein